MGMVHVLLAVIGTAWLLVSSCRGACAEPSAKEFLADYKHAKPTASRWFDFRPPRNFLRKRHVGATFSGYPSVPPSLRPARPMSHP